jgi:hypothetical protein
MKNKNKITIIIPMSDADKLLVIKTFNEYFDYTSIYDTHNKVFNVMVKPVLRAMPINVNLEGSFEDIINDMLNELVKRDVLNTISQKEAYVGPGSWT